MGQQITYLITAATGVTGRAVIAALQVQGQQNIRALAHREDERSEQLRKQGVEVVFGDLLDFNAVRMALQGVKRAYFCFPIAPGMVQATAQFAQAAREVGVDAIVNMSKRLRVRTHTVTMPLTTGFLSEFSTGRVFLSPIFGLPSSLNGCCTSLP